MRVHLTSIQPKVILQDQEDDGAQENQEPGLNRGLDGFSSRSGPVGLLSQSGRGQPGYRIPIHQTDLRQNRFFSLFPKPYRLPPSLYAGRERDWTVPAVAPISRKVGRWKPIVWPVSDTRERVPRLLPAGAQKKTDEAGAI